MSSGRAAQLKPQPSVADLRAPTAESLKKEEFAGAAATLPHLVPIEPRVFHTQQRSPSAGLDYYHAPAQTPPYAGVYMAPAPGAYQLPAHLAAPYPQGIPVEPMAQFQQPHHQQQQPHHQHQQPYHQSQHYQHQNHHQNHHQAHQHLAGLPVQGQHQPQWGQWPAQAMHMQPSFQPSSGANVYMAPASLLEPPMTPEDSPGAGPGPVARLMSPSLLASGAASPRLMSPGAMSPSMYSPHTMPASALSPGLTSSPFSPLTPVSPNSPTSPATPGPHQKGTTMNGKTGPSTIVFKVQPYSGLPPGSHGTKHFGQVVLEIFSMKPNHEAFPLVDELLTREYNAQRHMHEDSLCTSELERKDENGYYFCRLCRPEPPRYLHLKSLIRHVSTHFRVKPFACLFCDDRFTRTDVARKHLASCRGLRSCLVKLGPERAAVIQKTVAAPHRCSGRKRAASSVS